MGLRRRLRQAEQITDGLFNSFELEDGSVYRYESKEVLDALQNLYFRGKSERTGDHENATRGEDAEHGVNQQA